MIRFMFFLTFVYIVIEAQAFSALLSIYMHPVSPDAMGDMEQLGYVTAALGLTLLGVKLVLRTDINKQALWLAVPLFYLSGFELVHGVVNRLPLLVQDKPGALKAGVSTLTEPSLKHTLSFWLTDNSRPLTAKDASTFNTRFAVNDRLVSEVYIEALENINRFHHLYSRETETLTQEKIRTMRVRTMQALYAQDGEPVSYNSAINLLAYERHVRQHSPFHWASTILSDAGLNTHNPVLSELVDHAYSDYPEEGFLTPEEAPLVQIDKYYVMDKLLLQKTWNKWREIMPYLGPYPANNKAFDDKFVSAITAHYITPLTGDARPIPLDRNGQSRYYLRQVERIAPFFFSNGAPLISLSKVYDYDTRHQYIDNLEKGLHPMLRGAFDRYRQNAIMALSKDTERWSRPMDREMNIDLVRVGAILPVMFLLSAVLIAVNILTSGVTWKERIMLSGALAVGLVLAYSPASVIIRDVLLFLSYRHSQVFLT